MCIETADCVLLTRSAARVNEPVSTMARKERSWSVSSMAINSVRLWKTLQTFVGPINGKPHIFVVCRVTPLPTPLRGEQRRRPRGESDVRYPDLRPDGRAAEPRRPRPALVRARMAGAGRGGARDSRASG